MCVCVCVRPQRAKLMTAQGGGAPSLVDKVLVVKYFNRCGERGGGGKRGGGGGGEGGRGLEQGRRGRGAGEGGGGGPIPKSGDVRPLVGAESPGVLK